MRAEYLRRDFLAACLGGYKIQQTSRVTQVTQVTANSFSFANFDTPPTEHEWRSSRTIKVLWPFQSAKAEASKPSMKMKSRDHSNAPTSTVPPCPPRPRRSCLRGGLAICSAGASDCRIVLPSARLACLRPIWRLSQHFTPTQVPDHRDERDATAGEAKQQGELGAHWI